MTVTGASSLHFAAPLAFSVNKHISLIQINEDKVEHVMLMVIGGAFLGMLVMIATLFLKLLVDLISSGVEPGVVVETDFLLPKQVISFTYGTYDDQEDVESGKGSCSFTEDLHDWKICVICYDQQKCCFFVPCGHCVTCETCAKRIAVGENKTCPICRSSIRRVKKILMS